MRLTVESRAAFSASLVDSSCRILYAILAVAGFLRLLLMIVLRSYNHPITWEFGEQARTLYAGHGYASLEPTGVWIPSAHMPPLYPYLLDAAWKIFGQVSSAYLVLEVLQAVLGVLLVYFVYRLAALLTPKKVALLAAAMTAIWPSFIYLCNEFHSISVSILLAVAAVYYLVRLIEGCCEWKDVAGFGLSMGVLFLCRAEAIVLLPCYACVLVWHGGRGRLRQAVSGCLVALACLLPWTIRNYRSFGHVVIVSTSGGFNLWVGHNAGATGNSDYDLRFMRSDEQALTESVPLARDREVRLSRFFHRFAVDYMLTHPAREVSLSARKAFFFVLFDPTHRKGRQVGYWLPSILLTVLGFYGMYLERNRLLKAYLPLTLSMVFSLALAVALFSLPRYRISIDPFLVVFAATAMARLLEVFSKKGSRERVKESSTARSR